ncbi:Zn-ribbon domain-containing OB-fold protein [Chelatococcus asaccharovorans]|uniref:Zn-ribbon domain-containing OB-fold protein n=1 Tax=Chelatococcus asaccharovorans TaxID=28210 RepID=UPI00224C6668|nr:OB-fold domain-containing protein [Chelatococcus asaccharovorans]CAH1669417.1 OB_aCoA_assoc domain-containing protein [Chelatococcus asaccharovorans]CAH1679157.1 OB_aCoA_assoc domain-containing protein [Chelatococcus asaccharovorans]
MLAIPDSWAQDLTTFPSDLSMPYTLTPGRAAGTFVAEVKNRRIVGSRFASGTVVVPAQDFCPNTGDSDPELVEAPHTGTLNGFTQTDAGIIALIRIDGSDVDMTHRILGTALDGLKVGQRVEAVWGDGEGILAIEGFRIAANAPQGEIRPLEAPAKPVEQIPYHLDLHYEHAFGPYYGRLFDEIKTNRRIMGVRTSDGEGALLPPREIDDITHKPTGTWVELKQTGTVRAMSVIHLEFIGQTQPPPYIYAEIMLDGASTRLIHNVGGIDMSRAKELVKPGTRVRAVWREGERTGSLADISHFEVIDGEE